MRTIPERPIFELCRKDKPGFRVHTPDPALDNVELGFLEFMFENI